MPKPAGHTLAPPPPLVPTMPAPHESGHWGAAPVPTNAMGTAGYCIGITAMVAVGCYVADGAFGPDEPTGWHIAVRVLGVGVSLIAGVVAIVFRGIGMTKAPKGWAIAGLGLGIVAILALPTFFVVWNAQHRIEFDDYSIPYGTYRGCLRDPETTLSQCKSEFGQ